MKQLYYLDYLDSLDYYNTCQLKTQLGISLKQVIQKLLLKLSFLVPSLN